MGGSGTSFERVRTEPSVEGMQYNSNLEDFKHNNAVDKDLRKRIIDYMKRRHGSVEDLYYEMQEIHHNEMKSSADEEKLEDAVKAVNDFVPSNVRRGWFVNADSDYKPRLFSAIMDNQKLLNAGLSIMYENYRQYLRSSGKSALPFRKWLYTPITMYRGSSGQKLTKNDRFVSYTFDKKIAEKFAGKSPEAKVETIRMRPIDTLGGYQTTGESEILIPRWRIKK